MTSDVVPPARLARRVAARMVDTLVTAGIALVVVYGAGFVALVASGYDLIWGGENEREFVAAWVSSAVALSWLAALYEVVAVSRRGQTLGKMIFGVVVVRWVERAGWGEGAPSVSRARSLVRFAVLHGVAAVGAAVGGGFAHGVQGDRATSVLWAALAAVGCGLAVYALSLFDVTRRGWHDRAAGTLVVDVSVIVGDGDARRFRAFPTGRASVQWDRFLRSGHGTED